MARGLILLAQGLISIDCLIAGSCLQFARSATYFDRKPSMIKLISKKTSALFHIPKFLVIGLISLLLNPLFLVPFLAGATYGYFYSDKVGGVRLALADPKVGWDDKDTNPVRKALAEKARKSAEEQKKAKKELTKSGVLSQTRSGGTAATEVDVPWGTDVLKDKPAPISGSVSRVGPRDWMLRVFNNTEDTYSASLEVVQMARGGNRLKSDHYSYTLKPKQKVERKFSTLQTVTDCSLNLTKWKNLSGDKKKAAEMKKTAVPVVTIQIPGNADAAANNATSESN